MSVNDKARNWLKEPLVHFLIGGLLIYAMFAWRGEPVDPASRTIEISRADRAQLSLGFERMMGRSPTDAELDSQVKRFVREEVLYREALRLGLDGNDGVVRRRLSQKMDLLAAAQAETALPSDETLQEWYDAHPERFADASQYTLDQVFKSEMGQAKERVASLNSMTKADDWKGSSDPISLPASLSQMPRKEVLDRFGEQFLANIDALKPGKQWQGPVQSGFGYHAVRLRALDVGEVPPLDEVRDRVENDWRTATIEKRKERGYAILRDAYTIEIAE
ncbi:MAG: peptidylprolyl isomerase [Marinomonas sp.]